MFAHVHKLANTRPTPGQIPCPISGVSIHFAQLRKDIQRETQRYLDPAFVDKEI